MTNRELIDKLQTFPDDLEIVTQDEQGYLPAMVDLVDTVLLTQGEQGYLHKPWRRDQKLNLYIRI